MSMLTVLNASENDQYLKLKHTAALVSIISIYNCAAFINSLFFLRRFCFHKKRIPVIMEKVPADAADYCEIVLEVLLNMSNSLSIEV